MISNNISFGVNNREMFQPSITPIEGRMLHVMLVAFNQYWGEKVLITDGESNLLDITSEGQLADQDTCARFVAACALCGRRDDAVTTGSLWVLPVPGAAIKELYPELLNVNTQDKLSIAATYPFWEMYDEYSESLSNQNHHVYVLASGKWQRITESNRDSLDSTTTVNAVCRNKFYPVVASLGEIIDPELQRLQLPQFTNDDLSMKLSGRSALYLGEIAKLPNASEHATLGAAIIQTEELQPGPDYLLYVTDESSPLYQNNIKFHKLLDAVLKKNWQASYHSKSYHLGGTNWLFVLERDNLFHQQYA